VTEDTLKLSMDRAVKSYSSLFRLPSTRKVLSVLALLCIGGNLCSIVILFPSFSGVMEGVFLGLALFVVTLCADSLVKWLFLKQDTIFDIRRTMALSLFCWSFWLFFISIGVGVASVFGLSWLVRMCLLGFAAVIMLRLTVFSSTSSMNHQRVIAASLLQPYVCMVPFLLLWIGLQFQFTYGLPLFFFLSLIIGQLSVYTFLASLNRLGKKMLGFHSLSFFRAFMLNWVLNLNEPFEELLEKLGEERQVDISVIKFASSRASTLMVVPSIHPGPFKNIGSSQFPSLLKADLEKHFNCIACVPHGLLGHEFDLASQSQNQKVINEVITAVHSMEASETEVSPFVKISDGLATACCQTFGKSAFVSFTLAPKTIEDLPEELGFLVREEAKRHGLELCAVVNAHNSIDGSTEMKESLASLESAATTCLDSAVSMRQSPFEVGAASLVPKEFNLEDGMGNGGITVVVIKQDERNTAYVVIDGNNMISGLRERILSAISSLGVEDGEVLTTDTHSVSGLALTAQGYHPIGAVMDNEKLILHIKDVTRVAVANMEVAKASCKELKIPSVKVIGAKQLESLCLLVDESAKRAKRIVGPVFGVSGLFLMLFLLLV
jgi:putative membrane protein